MFGREIIEVATFRAEQAMTAAATARWKTACSCVFRNCRLIGRRFRLAHVVFGREIIEVATFRAEQAMTAAATARWKTACSC
ncbi:hypothetical protein C7E25_23800, partial [Stenotrophomonas maltophilia]